MVVLGCWCVWLAKRRPHKSTNEECTGRAFGRSSALFLLDSSLGMPIVEGRLIVVVSSRESRLKINFVRDITLLAASQCRRNLISDCFEKRWVNILGGHHAWHRGRVRRNIVSKVSSGSNKCLWPLPEVCLNSVVYSMFYNNMFCFFNMFSVSSN